MEGEGSILEVTGLEKSYGRNKVLKGVDLTVRKGEVIALSVLRAVEKDLLSDA